jgi:zinc transport system permease protein
MNLNDILQLPFFQRALIAGIIISILCAIWGVFIVLRKQAFLSDAVAHASLTGIAIGLLLGLAPMPLAIATGVILAAGITYFKSRTILSDDSLIGILYTFLFAIGLLLLNLFPGFRPDLLSYLFGSLLSVSWGDIVLAGSTLAVTLVLVAVKYKQLLYFTFDPESARLRGINTRAYEYLVNILSAVATIIAIKSVGIVMVSALLLVPAASARLLAKNFHQMFPYAVTVGLISAISGSLGSYILNTPSGPTIVVVSVLIFFGIYLCRPALAAKNR